jgi:hypothetical protein
MYTIEEQDVSTLNQGLVGGSFPPFIVKDSTGAPVYFGVTRAACEEWIQNNTQS